MFFKIARKLLQRLGGALVMLGGRGFQLALSELSKDFDKALNNVDFNMSKNGENLVLKKLSDTNPRCVFDVGANVGEYAAAVMQLCPNSIVYSFEIVPSTFEQLVVNVKSMNVVPVNKGLSDKAGMIEIYVSGRESTSATACKIEGLDYHDSYYSGGRVYDCEVITGKEFMKTCGVNEIDLLKVDVEGMDYRVLNGFGDALGRVKVIQFEYGVFNISSRDLLVDFYRLLKSYGFVIGKIMPKGVLFRDYHFNMEDFYGNNYLAVKKTEQELIDKLKL